MLSPRDTVSQQCSPFHVNTPLAPEIERLRRVTGIQEADDAELALAKLRSFLARAVPDVEQALRYYGAVLSIPACSEYEPVDLGSPSERERAFQVLIDVLIAASRKRPILIIVEDVQWMDPTSIELVLRDNGSLFGERVMILITHRDDYQRGLVIGSGSSTDCPAKTGAARMRADGRSRRRQRCRAAPDYQPDRGKNRRRAALRRGVYAGRDQFPRGRARR